MGNGSSLQSRESKFVFNPERPIDSDDAFVIFKTYLPEDSDRLDRENAKRFLQDLADAIEVEYNSEQADKLFDACTSPDDRFLSFPSFKKMIWKTHESLEKQDLIETKPVVREQQQEKKPMGKYARATSPFRGRGERDRGHDKGQHRNTGTGKPRLSQGWDRSPVATNKTKQKHRFNISASMLGDPFEKTKVFGVPLEIAASRNKHNRLVPLPLVQAFEYIETAKVGNYLAIEEEGLYRVPGSHQAFVQYRENYNMGLEFDYSKEQNVENVALIVIKYFKELPKSVLFPLDREFSACQKAAGGDPLELIRTLPQLLETLGDSSVETLRALVKHLQEVIKHSEKNKMTHANVERTFAICLGPTFGWLVGVLVENDLLPDERVYKGVVPEEESEEKKEESEWGTKSPGWAPSTPSPPVKSQPPRSLSPPLSSTNRADTVGHDSPVAPHSPSYNTLPGAEGLPDFSQELRSSGIDEPEEKEKSGLKKSGSGVFRRSKQYQGSRADGYDKKRNKTSFLGKKTRTGLDPGASQNRKASDDSERPNTWVGNQPLKPGLTMKSTFPHSGELKASNPSRLWYSMYTPGKYVLEIGAPESVLDFAFIEITVDVVDVEWENIHTERLTSSSPRLRLEFRVHPLEEGEEEYRGLVIAATTRLKPNSEMSSLPERMSCQGTVSVISSEGPKDFTTLPFLYEDDFSVALPVKNNLKIDEIMTVLSEERKRISQLLPQWGEGKQ